MKKSKLTVTPITMALTFIGLSLAHLSPLVSAVSVTTTTTPEPVSAKALWQPGMSMMQEIREKCGAAGTTAGECFAAEMRRSGATSAAVAFTNLIGNTGYLRDFREAGRVDVAYVNYPFRANENQGCLLVNGTPAVIDVDDTSGLPPGELMKNGQYAALAAKHPNVALFPGDRSGTAYPQVERLGGGGQRFVVSYRLTDGCHACARLGSAQIAFDFDARGNLLDRKLLAAGEAQSAATPTNEGEQQTLRARAGQEFTLRLDANRTTGYGWQLAAPLDESVAKLVGTEYEGAKTNLPGAGGDEVWTFRAVRPGTVVIKMKYVRPWEKNVAPARSTVFVVQVE